MALSMDSTHKSHLTTEDLVAINRDIRKSELKSLKFLSKRIIPEGKLENIEQSYELFATLLQEIGPCLSDRKLIVAQFLYLIGRNDLVSMLKVEKSFVHLSIQKSRILNHFRIHVLFELCKNLESSDIKDIKFLLGNEIFQKSQLAKIYNGEDLISELESIYPDEIELAGKLRKWFVNLGKDDLVNILKKYETNQSYPQDMLQETNFTNENSQICTNISLPESSPASTFYIGSFEGGSGSDENLGVYPMNFSPHGICLIVNNKDFGLSRKQISPSKELDDRPGTEVDAGNIENLFKNLDFEVVAKNNLSSDEVKDLVLEYGKGDHSYYDCFFAFILSHGDVGCVYGVDGKEIPIKSLLTPFRTKNCPTLKSKPKVFFIQACQGNDVAEADDLCTDSADPKILEEADFLLSLSTLPGFLSVRSRGSGTWYIGSLIDVIKKYYTKCDLMQMLTEVTRLVNKKKATKDGKPLKQVPVPITTLTKQLKLM